MRHLKTLQKVTSLFLLIALFFAILTFIIYPYSDEIQIYAKSFNSYDIARNTTLKTFTQISKPNTASYIEEVDQLGAMEHITPEIIAQYKNDGRIIENLELKETTIEISKVNIEGAIYNGDSPETMSKGFWHFPLSSSPGKKGNTVIIGHRFDKLPPETDTFFNLDQVEIGDKIVIRQNDGSKHNFTIVETKVVEKNDRSVLANTTDYRITLITCTPLWTSDQRLIVVAKLDKIYNNI